MAFIHQNSYANNIRAYLYLGKLIFMTHIDK